jgi:hypothetical protein
MGKETGKMKKIATKRAVIYGMAAAGFLAAVFGNSSLVMAYFTKGGIYALLPVATVFIFSFVHGSFASNVWTALGITASVGSEKRPEKRPEKRVRIEKRTPDSRPRATLNM